MTKPNIPEIEKQLDGITPGEWFYTDTEVRSDMYGIVVTAEEHEGGYIYDYEEENLAFIASAPSTIRSLIAYIKELEAENERLTGNELSVAGLSWFRHFTRNIDNGTPLYVEIGERQFVKPCGLTHDNDRLTITTIPKF